MSAISELVFSRFGPYGGWHQQMAAKMAKEFPNPLTPDQFLKTFKEKRMSLPYTAPNFNPYQEDFYFSLSFNPVLNPKETTNE